jgi:hypothetical protein
VLSPFNSVKCSLENITVIAIDFNNAPVSVVKLNGQARFQVEFKYSHVVSSSAPPSFTIDSSQARSSSSSSSIHFLSSEKKEIDKLLGYLCSTVPKVVVCLIHIARRL